MRGLARCIEVGDYARVEHVDAKTNPFTVRTDDERTVSYSIKDQAMVDAAEYELMLWDGREQGHIEQFDQNGPANPSSSYLAPKKTLRNLSLADDVLELLEHVRPDKRSAAAARTRNRTRPASPNLIRHG